MTIPQHTHRRALLAAKNWLSLWCLALTTPRADYQIVINLYARMRFCVKREQKLRLDAAKFSSSEKNIFIKSQQNFCQGENFLPSRQEINPDFFNIINNGIHL